MRSTPYNSTLTCMTGGKSRNEHVSDKTIRWLPELPVDLASCIASVLCRAHELTTAPPCSDWYVCRHFCLLTSHSLDVPSREQDTTFLPRSTKSTSNTPVKWRQNLSKIVLFQFNIIDFIENRHFPYRNIVEKFKSIQYRPKYWIIEYPIPKIFSLLAKFYMIISRKLAPKP